MLIITEKRHGVSIIDCWFADEPIKMDGIIRYKQSSIPLSDVAEEFESLITNLTEDEETILSHIAKDTKYQIRRAPKEGVVFEAYSGNEITDQMLEQYYDFYEEFWASKGSEYKEKEKQLNEAKKYRDANAYVLTVAKKDEKELVYHTYIVGEDFARSHQSASQFRTDETVTSRMIGYANRFLHYQDMLYFKNAGKKFYDWGGAGLASEVASITEFKKAFGGIPVIQYNSEEVKGAAAKMYRAAINLLK